jgi:hypothetical protein
MKSFRLLRAFFLLAFSLSLSALHAQIKEETMEFDSYTQTEYLDLGKNGLAIVDYNNMGQLDYCNITRIDTAGNLVYEKDVTFKNSMRYTYHPVASANGNDIYVLVFKDSKGKGGGQEIILLRFDAATGEVTQKEHDLEDFGHVLTMYANDKYFFAITTFEDIDVCRNEKCAPVMYRFDRNTLDVKKLDSELTIESKDHTLYWQIIRVENDFVEGYIIASVDEQKISVALARFDNEGKKIKEKEGLITLKENFPRPANSMMQNAAGVKQEERTNVIAFQNGVSITVMAWCYMLYDPGTAGYYAYGISGPDEFRKLGPKQDGFYVAKFDKDFKLETVKEHTNLPPLTESKRFFIHSTPETRYIEGYLGPQNQLILEMGAEDFHCVYSVAMKTLALGKFATPDENITSPIIHCAAPADLLLAEKCNAKTGLQMFGYPRSTARCQYYILANYKNTIRTIYSEPIKKR